MAHNTGDRIFAYSLACSVVVNLVSVTIIGANQFLHPTPVRSQPTSRPPLRVGVYHDPRPATSLPPVPTAKSALLSPTASSAVSAQGTRGNSPAAERAPQKKSGNTAAEPAAKGNAGQSPEESSPIGKEQAIHSNGQKRDAKTGTAVGRTDGATGDGTDTTGAVGDATRGDDRGLRGPSKGTTAGRTAVKGVRNGISEGVARENPDTARSAGGNVNPDNPARQGTPTGPTLTPLTNSPAAHEGEGQDAAAREEAPAKKDPTQQTETGKGPKGTITLPKVSKLWQIKPGQKLSVPEGLKLELPKDMPISPGAAPLTEDQLAQLRKILSQHNLRQMKGLTREQLKKLLAARKDSERSQPALARTAAAQPAEKKPTPPPGQKRPATARKPATPREASVALMPPGMTSPFRYRTWNPVWQERYAPVVRDGGHTPTATPARAAERQVASTPARPGTPESRTAAPPAPGVAKAGGETTTAGNGATRPGGGQTPGTTGGGASGGKTAAPTSGGGAASGNTVAGSGTGARNSRGNDASGGATLGGGNGSGGAKAGSNNGSNTQGSGSSGGKGGTGSTGSEKAGSGTLGTGGSGQNGSGGGSKANSGGGKGNGNGNTAGSGGNSANGTGSGANGGGTPGAGGGSDSGKGAGGTLGGGGGAGQGNGGNSGAGDGKGNGSSQGNGSGQGGTLGGGGGSGAGGESRNGTPGGGGGGTPMVGGGSPTGGGAPAGGSSNGNGNGGGTAAGTGGSGDGGGGGTGGGVGGAVLSGFDSGGYEEAEGIAGEIAEGGEGNGTDTGFAPAQGVRPDFPEHNYDQQKGLPGALVLPPLPPVGTETGKATDPRPIKKGVRAVAAVRRIEVSKGVVPRRASVPVPAKRSASKPRYSVVGSASRRGTIPVHVIAAASRSAQSEGGEGPLATRAGEDAAQPQSERLPVRANRDVAGRRKEDGQKEEKGTAEKRVTNSHGVKEGTLTPLPPTPLPDSDAEIGDGSGLKGEYYLGRNFEQFQFTRADKNLDLFWGGDRSPSPRLPVGADWSCRWWGRVQPRYSGTYTIYAVADDGVRVWVNHKLIIDDWTLHPLLEYSGRIRLEAGKQYDIRVDYFESGGPPASVGIYWESADQKKEFIPEECLFYPLAGDKIDLNKYEKPRW